MGSKELSFKAGNFITPKQDIKYLKGLGVFKVGMIAKVVKVYPKHKYNHTDSKWNGYSGFFWVWGETLGSVDRHKRWIAVDVDKIIKVNPKVNSDMFVNTYFNLFKEKFNLSIENYFDEYGFDLLKFEEDFKPKINLKIDLLKKDVECFKLINELCRTIRI